MMLDMLAPSTGGMQVPVLDAPRAEPLPPLTEPDPEALIEEARRRTRRRRQRYGAIAAGLLALGASGYAFWGGGGRGDTQVKPHQVPRSGRTSPLLMSGHRLIVRMRSPFGLRNANP